jgi:hypothetical protein
MKKLLIILLLCTPLFADNAVIDGWIIWHTESTGFVFDRAVDDEAQWNRTVAGLIAKGMDCDSLHTVYWELVFPPGMVGIQDNITCTIPSDRSTCESMELYGSGIGGAAEDQCNKGVLLAAVSVLLILAFTKFTRRS